MQSNQALQGLSWFTNRGGSASSTGPAEPPPLPPAEQLARRLGTTRGVPAGSVELCRKFYAFCGLPKAAARRAASGTFEEVDGLLGMGVYCTLSLEVARGPNFDREVLLVRFYPAGIDERLPCCGIKVTNDPDRMGYWREEGFAGCWQPLDFASIRDPRGELCIRSDCISKASAHHPQAAFGSGDRSVEVRKTARCLADGIPGTLMRLQFRAGLVRWTSVAFALASLLAALGLLWARCFGSASGALCIAVMFWISGF